MLNYFSKGLHQNIKDLGEYFFTVPSLAVDIIKLKKNFVNLIEGKTCLIVLFMFHSLIPGERGHFPHIYCALIFCFWKLPIHGLDHCVCWWPSILTFSWIELHAYWVSVLPFIWDFLQWFSPQIVCFPFFFSLIWMNRSTIFFFLIMHICTTLFGNSKSSNPV